jgi:hypothetical protein
MVLPEPIEEWSLASAGKPRGHRLGEGEKRRGVAASNGRGLSARFEPVRREHPDGRQEAEAGTVLRHDGLSETVVREHGDALQDIDLRGLGVTGDGLGLVQAKAAGEHREAFQQPLLGRLEQVVAPRNRALERPLPLGQVAAPGARQVQPPAQALRDVARWEQRHPRRRQLNAEWQSVQQPADADDGLEIAGSQTVAGTNPSGAVLEQAQCVARAGIHGGVGDSERCDRVLLLTRDAQRCAARHDKRDRRGRAEQLRQQRRRGQHVLEIVDHDERRAIREEAA